MDLEEQYASTEERLLELQMFREKWRQELMETNDAINSSHSSRVVPTSPNNRSVFEIVGILLWKNKYMKKLKACSF